ncbi:hypothetical protein OA187_02135 [Candidatus Pelagibacter sp.]|nr:hypothetical protein [Candidatus Pelagibacter sp.]
MKLKLYNLSNLVKKKIKKNINFKVEFISTNEKKKVNTNLKNIKIYWGNRLNTNVLSKLKNLKWVHFGSSGIDFELKRKILQRNIKFTRSNKIIAESVVASIIQKIFFLGRGMMPLLHKKYYDRKDFDKNFNHISDIFNEKALIFGKGEIATTLKGKLNAIGIKTKIVQIKEKNNILKNKKITSIIKDSKFIINCLPLNLKTKNFFDKRIFSLFYKSYFINVGRGETISQNDLEKFLKKNNIIFAALDVFNKKDYISPYRPLSYRSKLWNNNKILITPHISALSNLYWEKQTKLFLQLLNKFSKNLL